MYYHFKKNIKQHTIDNNINKKCLLSTKSAYNYSEGSCDTEAWSKIKMSFNFIVYIYK